MFVVIGSIRGGGVPGKFNFGVGMGWGWGLTEWGYKIGSGLTLI